MTEIKDKICPFMSNTEKKSFCDTNCQMYGPSMCDGEYINEPSKTCTLNCISYYLEQIANNIGKM